MKHSIEIDCAPCTPRPDSYLEGVLEGTGIPVRPRTSAFFGNWVWDYSDIDDAVWAAANETIKNRLTALYNSGKIRYASW